MNDVKIESYEFQHYQINKIELEKILSTNDSIISEQKLIILNTESIIEDKDNKLKSN